MTQPVRNKRLPSSLALDEQWRGGVWDEPAWFLADIRLLDASGFPLHLRRAAATQLRWLYNAEVCRELIGNGNGAVVSDLFFQVGWCVSPLLELGLDLDVVGRITDSKLLADLRSTDAFASAATELSVWANLCRQRFQVERVATTDGKTCDFRVIADHRLHRLEVKRVQESDYERVRASVSLELQMAVVGSAAFPNSLSVLRPSARWESLVGPGDLVVLRNWIRELRKEVQTAVERARAAQGAIGRYSGGSLVCLDIEPAPGFVNGSATEELLPQETQERRADRSLRLVRDACAQLRTGIGIVVLDVGESVDPMRIREALVAKVEGHPVRYSSCETVIVRGVAQNQFGEPTQYAYPISLVGPLNPAHRRIADAVSLRHFRNPTMGRRGSRLIT